MNIISRQEARDLGLLTYYSGTSCSYGHVAERYTSSGACVRCVSKKAPGERSAIAEQQANYFASKKESGDE